MDQLMEEILSPENIQQALKKVKANKGASGVDGVGVAEIETYMEKNWSNIKEQIQKRKYKPQPVLRVEIPKANGGTRKLGIPTVIDRVIEQGKSPGHKPNSRTSPKRTQLRVSAR